MRYYRVDLLDYYRGTLTTRRLGILIRMLPPDCATSRAMNGGQPPMDLNDHLVADLWSLILQVNSEKGAPFVDQPRRVEMEQAAHARDKESRIAALKAEFRAKQAAYGIAPNGGAQ